MCYGPPLLDLAGGTTVSGVHSDSFSPEAKRFGEIPLLLLNQPETIQRAVVIRVGLQDAPEVGFSAREVPGHLSRDS
jgi:hypothetical protein